MVNIQFTAKLHIIKTYNDERKNEKGKKDGKTVEANLQKVVQEIEK